MDQSQARPARLCRGVLRGMLARRCALASRCRSSILTGKVVVVIVVTVIVIARYCCCCVWRRKEQGDQKGQRGGRVDDADRSGPVALGAQDGPADIEAAAHREQEAVGQRDEPAVAQGIWRGDAREACHRTASAGRGGRAETAWHRVRQPFSPPPFELCMC
jgi:hypothetical protein